MKREAALEVGKEAQASRHQSDLERLQPLFYTAMTAVTRTEGRLGLSHKPKDTEIQVLLVRGFRQLNDSMVLIVDILKAMVCSLFTCV